MLRLIALAFVVLTVFLGIAASPALAARGHEYDPNLTLGKPCTNVVCGAEELTDPSGVAVSETTGEIYVVDAGNHRIQVFSSAGAFLFMFGGQVNKTKVESGTASKVEENLCSAASGDECQPGGAGEGSFEEITGIAVDNSCALHQPEPLTGPACEVSDPSNGDVYVADHSTSLVEKFAASGEFLNQLDLTSFGEPWGVSVDPTGLLSVLNESKRIARYDNSAVNQPTGVLAQPGVGELLRGFSQKPNSLAADSTGDFYVGHVDLQNEFGKVAPTGSTYLVLTQALDKEASSAVAVDPTTDTVFVDNLTSVVAFSPAGSEVQRLEEAPLTEGAGIAVDAVTERLYVADRAAGRVIVYGPQAPAAPTVEAAGQFLTAVNTTEADLTSEVNPRSDAGEGQTHYRVEYGPCASLASCPGAPFPSSSGEGTLPPDFAAHPVTAVIEGLAPHTIYHFRVVAENDHGATPGPVTVLETEAPISALLPDDRQWQLVSPPRKLGARLEPVTAEGLVEASSSGGSITYRASTPTEEGAPGFATEEQLLAARGSSGWSSRDIGLPHADPTGAAVGAGPEYRFFSPDLSAAAVQPFGQFNPALSSAATEGTPFLNDLSGVCGSACLDPLVTAANVPPGTEFGQEALCDPTKVETTRSFCGPKFLGATPDLAHAVLSSRVPLSADPADTEGGLYEWSSGTGALDWISTLPDGSSAGAGVSLGVEGRGGPSTISADGSRVFWTVRGGLHQGLYLRADATSAPSASGACDEAGRACTLELDSATTGPGPTGGGIFQFASADGSRVFFTDENPLTEDSGAEHGKADLYECRIVEAAGNTSCDLTDLTPVTGGEAAEVQGSVLGGSADGSDVYLVAKGVLADNTVEDGAGEVRATAGRPNLYLVHEGQVSFVAGLSGGDSNDWNVGEGGTLSIGLASQPTRVSPDGRYLAIMSEASPTGYDDRDLATGRPAAEVYLFDAATGHLSCASCDPTGARPRAIEYRQMIAENSLAARPGRWAAAGFVASILPAWTSLTASGESLYQPRYLSDSGRLFFDSLNGLVAGDTNDTQDVYQYEQPGVGSCSEGSGAYMALSGGCISLLSSGTSREESVFLDASENGDDAFFLTYSRLNPRLDEDAALDLYDAHSCETGEGCLAEAPAPPPVCQGDACQQPATPPVDATPGSLTFSGAGNVVECPKGKVKQKGKCVKKSQKKTKKKHHKKSQHHKNSKNQHAKSKGGAGK